MKLSDVKSTGDSIFIPALEQNMMGAVLINDNDEVLFFGYTDLMVDGAPSPHQSDTTLRWLIDRLRS